jgi:hypothetical protein
LTGDSLKRRHKAEKWINQFLTVMERVMIGNVCKFSDFVPVFKAEIEDRFIIKPSNLDEGWLGNRRKF